MRECFGKGVYMLPNLYVIRHAQVEIDPNVPAQEWPLSKEGERSTLELIAAESWPDVSTIYHSPEPKAEQTATIIADALSLKMESHLALRELQINTGFLSSAEFEHRVGAFLEGCPDPDFEDYELAGNRIEQGVKDIVRRAGGVSTAIVSHGRILTVWFSRLKGRRLTAAEWKSIKLPDLAVIDVDTWTVKSGFFADV
ncbi:MAG: hypothetical protein JWN30_1054 [Bacilli bacterium]|nr:hypothetical protein [Bacilli bacterium]